MVIIITVIILACYTGLIALVGANTRAENRSRR
jgi:hypothetical protein